MIPRVRARHVHLSRRRLLIVLAAAGVAACAGDEGGDAPTRTSEDGPPPSPARGPDPVDERDAGAGEDAEAEDERPPPAGDDRPEPYEPLPDDVYPNAKRTGGRMAQTLATYEADEPLEHLVERAAVPTHPRFDAAAAAEAAAAVHHPEARSTGEVIYAQLGGLMPQNEATSASIIVVVRQRLVQPDGSESAPVRAMDIRLRLHNGQWAVDQLGDMGGQPVARPAELSAPAQAVVDHPRIQLPDSARWDIYRGDIDGRLLATMAELADQAPYAVTCLKSGHAVNVFGTERPSNHSSGRAVDIWQVEGTAVVSQQPDPGTAAHALAQTVFDRGAVSELGSPWAFDGAGGRSFQNDVHRDHLHVAFHA